MGILSFRMDIFTPGFYKKDPSSFRLHGNPFIILMLQAEGRFRHPSARLHFVWRRTEKRSPEIEKSFGWDWIFVWYRTFYRFLQWKETERWPFCPSFHNMLFDRWLACRLKDEGSFLKNLGRGSMRGVEASRLMAYGGNECSWHCRWGATKK